MQATSCLMPREALPHRNDQGLARAKFPVAVEEVNGWVSPGWEGYGRTVENQRSLLARVDSS